MTKKYRNHVNKDVLDYFLTQIKISERKRNAETFFHHEEVQFLKRPCDEKSLIQF